MSAAAKLSRGLSGTANSIPINLNEPMVAMINEVYETGLYGNLPSDVVNRIFTEGLEAALERIRNRTPPSIKE